MAAQEGRRFTVVTLDDEGDVFVDRLNVLRCEGQFEREVKRAAELARRKHGRTSTIVAIVAVLDGDPEDVTRFLAA